jgi:putative methyltransferase (TIGR04325 family)
MNHIWEGVYSRFADVPVVGDAHNSETWVSKSAGNTSNLLRSLARSSSIPEVPQYQSSLLPLLAAIAAAVRAGTAILDFGGGLGATYLSVVAGMPGGKGLDYHIVETPAICSAGKDLFHSDPKVHFHSTLPAAPKAFDIVHMGSSLQYIDDWRALIAQLASYTPTYILLTDLTAGDIPTFVTAQNYYGAKIPVRFFNINEILYAMAACGFKLIFRSRFKGTYLGKVQQAPQENFPPELRLGDTCSLLFQASA